MGLVGNGPRWPANLKLQIEELTLSSKVNQARYAMQSHSNTSYSGSNYSPPASSTVMHQIAYNTDPLEHPNHFGTEHLSDELGVNQTTLNLEAAPLIQMMATQPPLHTQTTIHCFFPEGFIGSHGLLQATMRLQILRMLKDSEVYEEEELEME
ncbi:uncharacterized protein LOC143025541 isoform X2 [Oratosquilla oratoria]|uniref:uncharacterized protein LOC143025541 isoform X2 n=1 Tax=Oratosquilla oratoria TaxID=337810 RepID=UPI003F76336B